MAKNKRDLEELEQLDVIESSTLKVGNAFHAFRFNVADIGKLDPATVKTLEAAVDKIVKEKGCTKAEAVKQIEGVAFSAMLTRAAKKAAKLK